MKLSLVLVVVGLLAGANPEAVAENPGPDVFGALEKKLLGAWEPRSGCAGNFLFRADGSYQLKGYGPAGDDSSGVWKMRWDALPPTLVLTCLTSDFEPEVGQSRELKVLRLDDERLEARYAQQMVDRYARAKKAIVNSPD